MKKLIVVMTVLMMIPMGVYAFPDTFSYQGRMFSPPGSGTPIADIAGNSVEVRMYDALTGGNLLWTSPLYNNVESKDGYFTVNIGGWGDVLSAAVDVWIEIDFNGETMAPRQELLPSPFAGKSVFVQNVSPYPDTIIYGPQSITSTTLNGATLSVTNTAGTGVVGFIEGINDGAGLAGYSYSTSLQNVGIYGYGEYSGGVMGQSNSPNATAVYGENLNGGIGVAGKGLTGVAAVSNDANGVGLVVSNTGGGTPMLVEGGNYAYFNGPGVLIDSSAYPAALFVSFTAGAWPAAVINAPNGQALEINGSGGGLGNPILDVKGMTNVSTVTAIHGYGGTDFGMGGAGVSGTAKNGTGVYGTGVTGVAGVSNVSGGIGVYAESYDFNGIPLYAKSSGGAAVFEDTSVTINSMGTPGALSVYSDMGSAAGIYVSNPPGPGISAYGSPGVVGESPFIGVMGMSTTNSAHGVVAQHDTATGGDAGSALRIKGKIAVSGGTTANSPIGVGTVQAGLNLVNVPNNLCIGGSYRVFLTPVSAAVDGGGNPISWWVNKQDGFFTINLVTQVPTVTDITFDYLIINNGL